MAVDDLVDVAAIDVGVPDRFGIDDQHRSFLAAIEAARLVDAHLAGTGETQRLDALLGVLLHLERAGVGAALLGSLALVAAEEDVTPVITHGRAIISFARPQAGLPASANSHAAARTGQTISTVCVRPL